MTTSTQKQIMEEAGESDDAALGATARELSALLAGMWCAAGRFGVWLMVEDARKV